MTNRLSKYAVTVSTPAGDDKIVYPIALDESGAKAKVAAKLLELGKTGWIIKSARHVGR
jgi:hypothetical protein